MKEDSLAKDYFPDPPTPTKRAFPPGISKILAILDMCSMAAENNTRFITALISLYSSNFSSSICFT